MVADLRMPPQAHAVADVHDRAGRVGLAGPHPVVHRLGRLAVAAAQAHHLERRAVDLDDPRRVGARLLVQPVDVLGDEQVEPPAALQVDQRRCPALGAADHIGEVRRFCHDRARSSGSDT